VEALFEPKSVVLIGSSKFRERVGVTSPKLFESVIYNMKKFYRGKVYVLDVEGRMGHKSLEELPEKPELGVLMLPPRMSLEQTEKCAGNGVKALIIITGGYTNPQREKLREICRESGVRILGPNTIMGVINTANGLNTTFERDVMPKEGGIAVISQSGGVGAYILDVACQYGVGVSKFAFMGDKIDVDDVDLLHYLKNDKKTKVVCLYMEGIENGREFIETAREVVKEKPILALKGGITEESAQRALSHTASISGSYAIFDAAFKKAGIIHVDDMEELLNVAVALEKQPPLRGDNVAIVSNVGGPAILAADAIAKNGLKLAQLSEETTREIKRRYPHVDAINPLDLIADARAKRYETVLDLVLSDPNVDGVLVINMLKSCFFQPEDAKTIVEASEKHPEKPIVDVSAGGEDFTLLHKVLIDTKIPLYNLPEKAAKALKALRTYQKIKLRG